MTNFLDNGSVLPHGLLGQDMARNMGGFNKTYRNTALRVGVIVDIYPVDDDNNSSGLSTEYDVMVMEQNEDKGSTTILYRNCIKADGFGSIADFMEMNLRPLQEKTSKGDAINLNDQDGTIVLLLCLDGVSDKGVIIGCMTHPDRETTLADDQPYLEGEYNGVNVVIDTDGSTILTFKGATDSQGEPTDDSQGDTTIQIETDGSFQIDHETITFRLDRTEGTATLDCDTDVDVITGGDVNVTADGDVNVDAKGDINAKAEGDIHMDGSGGQLHLSGETVAMGAGEELLDLFDQTLKLFSQTLQAIQAQTHGTGVGPSSPPINISQFIQLQQKVEQVDQKLNTIKGELP